MIIKTIPMNNSGMAVVRHGQLIKFSDNDTVYIAKNRTEEDGCDTCVLSDDAKRCLKICCYYKPIKLEEYVG